MPEAAAAKLAVTEAGGFPAGGPGTSGGAMTWAAHGVPVKFGTWLLNVATPFVLRSTNSSKDLLLSSTSFMVLMAALSVSICTRLDISCVP